MEFETIETERLYLKPLTPEDFEDLFVNHFEEEVIRLLGLADHKEYIREKEKSEGGYRTYDRSILAFLMILKANNETIGRCGFHNWYTAHNKAELGYIIFDEKHRKKGYMDEAVAAVIDFGFNRMKLNRIEASTSPHNHASLHIIQKHGFVREGFLRQHYVRDGVVEDSVIFSLLSAEYHPENDFHKL